MKKGFTLIEMLAVVALLGLLTLLVVPNIVEIRNSVLGNTYESKVTEIRAAATEYGNDHLELIPFYDSSATESKNCYIVTVSELIQKGYLAGEVYQNEGKKDTMVDPRDNTSMNNKKVCIRYDSTDVLTRKLVVYLMS